MPRKTSALPITLPARKGRELYRWIYEELRTAILEGRLQPGSRLQATRDLAESYQVSRPTIITAFEQLKSEGYVEGRVGSGTYVSQVLPDQLLEVPSTRMEKRLPRRRMPLSSYARRLHPFFPTTASKTVRAFRANQPALDVFPTTIWAQVAARRLRRVSASLLAGGESLGYRPLREAVAEYLNTARGVKCSPEQVLIVSGAQEALDRTGRILLDPGAPVWMEEPGYPGAVRVFQALGARIQPVTIDEEGLDPEVGFRRCPRARMVYITPAHQYPLGVTMTLRRRLALIETARRNHIMIFEDDYDSEYRYSGRPVPALQGLDRSEVVLFAGSFSAVLFPALRLGYLVVPQSMVDVFAAAGSVSTHHPPLLEQAVLCDFITEGHFARHVRRMRELYAERMAVLLESAQEKLSRMLEISNVEAGLQTIGWLQRGLSANAAAAAAAQNEVEVIPLNRYAWGHTRRQGLVLGFAAVDPREIRLGVDRLAAALQGIRRHRAHRDQRSTT